MLLKSQAFKSQPQTFSLPTSSQSFTYPHPGKPQNEAMGAICGAGHSLGLHAGVDSGVGGHSWIASSVSCAACAWVPHFHCVCGCPPPWNRQGQGLLARPAPGSSWEKLSLKPPTAPAWDAQGPTTRPGRAGPFGCLGATHGHMTWSHPVLDRFSWLCFLINSDQRKWMQEVEIVRFTRHWWYFVSLDTSMLRWWEGYVW